MATIHRLARPCALTAAELLAELGFDEFPEGFLLKPGETIRDRIPAKLARGRAVSADARRAAFRSV